MNQYTSDYYQAWHACMNYNNYILQNYYHHYIPTPFNPTGSYTSFCASSDNSGFYLSTPTAQPNTSSYHENVIDRNNDVSFHTSSYIRTNQESGRVRDGLLGIELELADKLCTFDYTQSGVHYISNPLDHAIQPHTNFLDKYLDGKKEILFLGMNPGPWGMCQTGVPFGDVDSCKHFLNISGEMKNPKLPQHPKRPVEGLNCKRKEVSGSRFWSLVQSLCSTPEQFFKHSFVQNHCPLAFMKESGKNLAPAEMSSVTKAELNKACDKALAETLEILGTVCIVAVGKYAEARANKIVKDYGYDISVEGLMHPSPINPAANKGWVEIATKALEEMNLMPYLQT